MQPAIADKLHSMIVAAMKSPEYQKHAASFMFDIQPVPRAQFAKLVADDAALWRRARQAAQIKLEH